MLQNQFSIRQFRLAKCSFFIHNSTPYINPMLDSRIGPRFSDCMNMCTYQLAYGPRREKPCLRRFANNTGADQPAHPRSLISAFVIRYLESIICKLATGEISIL